MNQEQEIPLIHLGPNNAYGTAYYGHISHSVGKQQARLIAVVGGSLLDASPKHYVAKPRTFLDRLFGIDRISFTPAAAAANTWDFSQNVKKNLLPHQTPIQLISMYLKNMTTYGQRYVTQLPLFSRKNYTQEQVHEFNTQTTRSPRINQETSQQIRLLPNNEGTFHRTRREQSNRFRACRGTHSQGRAPSGTKQSSLFINC